ncbi:pyrroline-5-carboxylate reductase [Alkalihalobacillus sp. CinArs1]|uniref:pyrroline-5-carboxylate reductase n=1 Tax=Alkalihalobacillus sp. CinArs1 TaxID=2995314 RepID=UPI0022DD654F|nr:pyrroline-5-carboxylate reductase [Alkalihalobacillus sp. CinArs1]
MLQNKTVTFIGAGSMAEAMAAGMIESGTIEPERIIMTNRSNEERRQELMENHGVLATQSIEFAVREADVVILAMKPKDIEKALKGIEEYITNEQLLLSVLAGVPSAFIEESLEGEQPVIRVMPNTSSMIGKSISALAAGKYVDEEQITIARALIRSIGDTVVIDEEQMDVFTGVAGSGPAYIYYVIESLEKAAVEGGLEEETARKMAVQTVLGAGMMAEQSEDSPSELRKKVTSPNGTTQAGLEALYENGGGDAFVEAVRNAAVRSKEISSQFDEENEKKPVMQ